MGGIMILISTLLTTFLWARLDNRFIWLLALNIVVLGLIGFFMPEMHCKATKKNRELSVRIDMPFFIDLLALSVEAGLDFFGAIQKIVDKAEGTESVLAEEFRIVLKDIKK